MVSGAELALFSLLAAFRFWFLDLFGCCEAGSPALILLFSSRSAFCRLYFAPLSTVFPPSVLYFDGLPFFFHLFLEILWGSE